MVARTDPFWIPTFLATAMRRRVSWRTPAAKSPSFWKTCPVHRCGSGTSTTPTRAKRCGPTFSTACARQDCRGDAARTPNSGRDNCQLLGTSETLLAHSHTSALPPFTDMLGIGPDSRDCPLRQRNADRLPHEQGLEFSHNKTAASILSKNGLDAVVSSFSRPIG